MLTLELKQQIKNFKLGKNYYSYKLFGAHNISKNKVRFMLWLPRVKSVSVVGSFNMWNRYKNKMMCEQDIWFCEIENFKLFENYNYSIETESGEIILKTDPYGYFNQKQSTKFLDIFNYKWKDKKWFFNRKNNDIRKSPMNIYQVHLNSWKKYSNGQNLTYKDFLEKLIPYVKNMGYTHIQIMPICEYRFDASLGYHTSNYYSPTNRYGIPNDLMELINNCHQNNIGVILDLVLSNFSKNEKGLYNINGLNCYDDLYEYDRDKSYNIKSFDFSKPEIQSFLISNVLYWFEMYHFDGINISDVNSILKLNYNKKYFLTNYFGGIDNLYGIEFLQKLNKVKKEKYPDRFIISSNETDFTLVTKNQDIGGLNFDFKWNNKCVKEILDYFVLEKSNASYLKLIRNFSNAFKENFILPISYKFFNHSQKSLISRMNGNYLEKFSSVRALISFIMAYPSKKLLFMGQEIGQFMEWDFNRELDWGLLEYKMHKNFSFFIKSVNNLYIEYSNLWEYDSDWKGFEWILNNDYKNQVLSFKRTNSNDEEILVVCNFSNDLKYNYCLGLPSFKNYKEIFSSDNIEFGGNGFKNKILTCKKNKINGYNFSINIDLPPMSVLYLKEI